MTTVTPERGLNMRKYLNRLRHTNPSEISYRILEECRFLRERIELKSTPVPRIASDAASVASPSTIPFESLLHPEETRDILIDRFPVSVERTMSLAEGILSNHIPVFSDIVSHGDQIDWRKDYKSGKRAPAVFYRDLHDADPSAIGDPKNIWELSRCNFMIYLAKAFLVSGDSRYYRKWREIILSWIADNPHKIGINWESSIELAFRAINWIWSSWFFTDQIREDRQFARTLYSTLYLHGRHIRDHLSYFYSPNTHLTGEALGLLYIAGSFPDMKDAPAWAAEATAVLDKQFGIHILPDGGYFERATYYHNYTIDIYTHYMILKGGPETWAAENIRRYARMIEHLALISEPDGTIPLLGDSDGGQLIPLSHSKNNIHGACCFASIVLDDGLFKHFCHSEFKEEALWLLGPAAVGTFDGLPDRSPDSYHSANVDTGYYSFRTGMEAADQHILIDCSPHGWKICGHAHADLLSFEWYSNGSKVIVDPGTCTYYASKKERDHFRISQSHNTITVNGRSQSVPGDTFKWSKIADPGCCFYKSFEDFGYFEGEHDAYKGEGCRHRRSVLFFGNELVIVLDLLSIESDLKSILFNLQLSEGRLIESGASTYEFTPDKKEGKHYIRIIHGLDASPRIAEGAVCPDYNKPVKAPRIELESSGAVSNTMIITLLSGDPDLLQSFSLDGNERLAGGHPIDYSIDLQPNDQYGSCIFRIAYKNRIYKINNAQIEISRDGL